MKLRWPEISDLGQLNLAWLGATALLILALLLGLRSEVDYRRQSVREASVQAAILASSVTAALAFDDQDAMREYVDSLKANPRVAAAAVYDASGRAAVSYRRAGAKSPPTRAGEVGVSTRNRQVEVTATVTERGARLGAVYLAQTPEPIAHVLGRHSGLALLTVMAVLLSGVIIRAANQLKHRAGELEEANTRLRVEIAERARAEDALRQSQKMEALGQLTGGIAHDFNNLLQIVQGALELIRRRPQDPKVTVWAENGLQASQRGASLTRQLLTFSRAQKLELQPFVVSDLIDEMGELLTRTLGGGIELTFDLDRSGATVLADRTQLELAVLNLAINARDAMADHGKLTVATRLREIGPGHPVLAADDYVELSVSDTGPGMAPDVIERAFDPFFTTKGVGKGTGLGLSQVYGVAHQAGGEARIESRPGGGASIILLLRRSAMAGTPVAAVMDADVAPTMSGATILLVDDDGDVRRLVAETLELLGYRVVAVDSGAAALAQLADAKPDLMVVDFMMPGMNGAEVATAARGLRPDLPIVFASGHADTAALEAAVGPGARMLHKPFQTQTLAATVAAALKAR